MKKFKNIEESMAYVRTLPIENVLLIAANSLLSSEEFRTQRITISEEQFNTFFKIRGINKEGKVETRGRKKKD